MEVLPGIIVDACFPEASYVLECDGMRWYSIDADRASDVTRSGALVADGWLIDRVRDVDVRDDRLALIAHIRPRAAREAAGLGRAPGWQPVDPVAASAHPATPEAHAMPLDGWCRRVGGAGTACDSSGGLVGAACGGRMRGALRRCGAARDEG